VLTCGGCLSVVQASPGIEPGTVFESRETVESYNLNLIMFLAGYPYLAKHLSRRENSEALLVFRERLRERYTFCAQPQPSISL